MNFFVLGSLLLFSLCNVFTNCFFTKKAVPTIKAPKTVRVLLHTLTNGQSPITLRSDKGFTIAPQHGKKNVLNQKILTLKYHKNDVMLNGICYATSVRITPLNGITDCDGKTYSGIFLASHENNKLLLVNCLNLEDYIYCVLKTESWPGWPLEINKVLAITCRTYALSMIEDAQRQKRSYHLTNTNLFQTYHGTHKTPVIAQAIQETQGQVITYDTKPILAMYDSCCGGVIPSRSMNIDYTKAPYLGRKYACTFCKNSPAFNWQASMPLDEFAKRIGITNKKITSVSISKKDTAGLVKELSVRGKKLAMNVQVDTIYALSRDIKSFCFDISKKSGVLTFTGRGLGHHVGLCQWGAREMVKKGYTLEKILQYYYPDTALGKII